MTAPAVEIEQQPRQRITDLPPREREIAGILLRSADINLAEFALPTFARVIVANRLNLKRDPSAPFGIATTDPSQSHYLLDELYHEYNTAYPGAIARLRKCVLEANRDLSTLSYSACVGLEALGILVRRTEAESNALLRTSRREHFIACIKEWFDIRSFFRSLFGPASAVSDSMPLLTEACAPRTPQDYAFHRYTGKPIAAIFDWSPNADQFIDKMLAEETTYSQ